MLEGRSEKQLTIPRATKKEGPTLFVKVAYWAVQGHVFGCLCVAWRVEQGTGTIGSKLDCRSKLGVFSAHNSDIKPYRKVLQVRVTVETMNMSGPDGGGNSRSGFEDAYGAEPYFC